MLCKRFEVFTAVTMKTAVFWDVAPCGFCKNRRFGGSYRLPHQGGKNQRARNNVGSSWMILSTLMMEATHGVTSQKAAFFMVVYTLLEHCPEEA
jgi:hypothetical protein